MRIPMERKLLEKIRRDLDACQKVIWLAGGFDPAYCRDAQDCLKEIDAALAATPRGQQCELGEHCRCNEGDEPGCWNWIGKGGL
jgi:hypothetical protein